MSIFNNVSRFSSSSTNDELKLLIRLKYGEPAPTKPYLLSLPSSVIDEAYRRSYSHAHKAQQLTKLEILYILLLGTSTRGTTLEAIDNALYQYHSLLG